MGMRGDSDISIVLGVIDIHLSQVMQGLTLKNTLTVLLVKYLGNYTMSGIVGLTPLDSVILK